MYFHDRLGRLGFMNIRKATTPTTAQQHLISDAIRLPEVYVESSHDIGDGHLVAWTGEESIHSADGLSRVEPANGGVIAGVVKHLAADVGDKYFTHRGIHTKHNVPGTSKIYRVGRDIVLAWVLVDDHENELEGVYQRYVNGELDSTGPYQIQMVSSDTFSIDRTMGASINTELAELRARIDALTTK